MLKLLSILLLLLFAINLQVHGQELRFKKVAISDSQSLALAMQQLASDYLLKTEAAALETDSKDRYKIEILSGRYEKSIQTIESLRKNTPLNNGHQSYIPYEIYAKAKIKQYASKIAFEEAYLSVFKAYLAKCSDQQAYSATIVFTTYDSVAQFNRSFEANFHSISTDSIGLNQALTLLKSYFLYQVFSLTEPIIFEELALDKNRRYIVNEELIISPRDGAELTVITVRKRNAEPQPAVLIFTIYSDASNEDLATLAAAKGYVGVVATSRGKRLSNDAIEPYKHEFKDVYAVIDWLSKQTWTNGTVGMYGGSYNGFTQWASLKEQVHPALKTIVPSVAVAPGLAEPMENGVHQNFHYPWHHYVSNNKYLDNDIYFDRNRWIRLYMNWYKSGVAYNEMDQLDSLPNPQFNERLQHPTYDSYWQKMMPYKEEFAHINIPILSTTGYYDGGQIGTLHYLNEHTKYNTNAEHYLVIGPYTHYGAQGSPSKHILGYEIDEVAHINITEMIFDWFDYTLKGEQKPALLKDKINYQVMGTNRWRHAPTLNAMANDTLTFFLSSQSTDVALRSSHHTGNNGGNSHFKLDKGGLNNGAFLEQVIDFSDRSDTTWNASYWENIIDDTLIVSNGFSFVSDPLLEEVEFNGAFHGEFSITINKMDFDYRVLVFEQTKDGKFFALTLPTVGRASFVRNPEKKMVLVPSVKTAIPFNKTRMTSKMIQKGSRLVVVINGIKEPFTEINYGTGKNVHKETVANATEPLIIKWHSDSYIKIPIWRNK